MTQEMEGKQSLNFKEKHTIFHFSLLVKYFWTRIFLTSFILILNNKTTIYWGLTMCYAQQKRLILTIITVGYIGYL